MTGRVLSEDNRTIELSCSSAIIINSDTGKMVMEYKNGEWYTPTKERDVDEE